jgi:hypothetical protein
MKTPPVRQSKLVGFSRSACNKQLCLKPVLYSDMSRKRPALMHSRQLTVVGFLVVLAVVRAPAAQMTPISLNGFNRDVMIENTASGPPYNSAALNFNAGEQRAYYQTNLPGTTRGLPLTGAITSASDGTLFQLQPYTANNALILSSDTGLTSGTLFLVTPRIYDSIAVIANSGNGDSLGAGSMTLHFADGSTFVTNYYAPDWFNNTGTLYSVALQGFQRILLAGGADGGTTNPRFYQTTLFMTNVPGGTTKFLSSITFGKPAANSTGIYAVSGATNASQTNVTFSLATLTNVSATSISTTGAVLNAKVVSTGNDAPQVTLYYGPVNGGANAAAWSNSVLMGWQTGSFSQSVSGLSFSTTYYFTTKAVNAGGTSWTTPSRSFITLTPTLATITNLPATSILANSASLNGQVLATGGDTPTVTIFYGPVDGGNNPAAWSNSISAGMQASSFTRGAFGLSNTTKYFFTARAVNAAGTAWAAASKSFTTLASNPIAISVPVFTQHNDNGRTGRNLSEAGLNVAIVNTNTFGLLYTRPVDDQIYAQPLVVTNVTIPGKGTHNIVIVATVNDSVYAFDADNAAVVAPYWSTNFLTPPNIVAPANTDMTGACGGNYHDFSGNLGIVGTPVVDPASGTIYLVARTLESGSSFIQRLHALDITTGAEKPNSPVIITGSFNGVAFDPQRNNQRAALTLANGVIFIGWSSHCDWGPYHGWIMSYNASTLAQIATYCDTPTGSQGGIWMSGQGPAADSVGNIFIATGNGSVGTTANRSDPTNRAMSFLKLNGANLTIMSWFTPYNWNFLNNGDWDLGAGGIMLIPGTSYAVGGGKSSPSLSSALYVVNRDNMGGLSGATTADTNIIQSIPVTPTGIGVNHIHGAPVWWDGPDGSYMYVWGESDHLHQYRYDAINGVFQTPAYSQSPTPAWVNGMTGGMLAISANGTNAGSGILWGSHQFTGDANQAVRPGILHAYDAQNVTNELWNSEQYSARDSIGLYAKFVPPTIANSKVYMATFSGRLNVYGVLPAGPPVIYQQPQSTTRFAGDPVTLTVSPGGSTPLSFQWKLNGNPIPGATLGNFTVSQASISNAGTYTCTITNRLGGPVVSSNAVLTIVPTPTISYPQVVLGDNPVAYWRLNETVDTVAHDSWGGHDGEYISVNQGQPGYSPNDPDTAAEFGTLSPSDSYVGNIQGIDFSTFANNATFSLEAWVNGEGFPQANGAGIITFGYGGGGEQFNLDTGNGGNFRLSIRDAFNFAHNANSSVAPNTSWQHVLGVCDEPNGLIHLYINGVESSNAAISGGIQAGTSPISIGSRESGFNSNFDLNFQGLIDEVAIYNYALTPAQVQNHYLNGLNPVARLYVQKSGANLVLYWSPGTLQSSASVAGPYSDVIGASAPYTVTPSNAQAYYRVRVK